MITVSHETYTAVMAGGGALFGLTLARAVSITAGRLATSLVMGNGGRK